MGAPHRPIGYEREYKNDYILLKVSEAPRYDPTAKKGDHVGWKLKHVHIWEQHHGTEKPKGCDIVFVDGDKTNFDPSNLALREKKLCGVMNQMKSEGITYHDMESFEACVALAKIRMAIHSRENNGLRKCRVCGREFEPDTKRHRDKNKRTCRSCLDAGMKYAGERLKDEPDRVCDKCGMFFHPIRRAQHTCSDCQPACVKARRKHPIKEA